MVCRILNFILLYGFKNGEKTYSQQAMSLLNATKDGVKVEMAIIKEGGQWAIEEMFKDENSKGK